MKPCTDRKLPAWVEKFKSDLNHDLQSVERLGGTSQKNEYCICRGPNRGFMIQCNECKEWFHGPCVKVDKQAAKVIDIYLCPNCDN